MCNPGELCLFTTRLIQVFQPLEGPRVFRQQVEPDRLAAAAAEHLDYARQHPSPLKLLNHRPDGTPQRLQEAHHSCAAILVFNEHHYGLSFVGGDYVPGVYQIRDFVEKPRPEKAPSNLVIAGRYLLTPDIFGFIEKTTPSAA